MYVDNKYAFSLSLSELIEYKIKNGQELKAIDIKKYKKISEEGKQKMRTLNWLLIRPRSVREFKHYLSRKKVEAELGEIWLADFIKRRNLNDSKFALWWVEARQAKNYSSKKIRLELAQKGISRTQIDEALAEYSQNDLSALRQVILKKGKLPRYKNDRNKFMRYLAGQGYNYSDIKTALDLPAESDNT